MGKIAVELQSHAALLKYLGLGKAEYIFLKRYVAYRYSAVAVPKRRGGSRTLLIPEPRLKYLQRKLYALLQSVYVRRAPVHGFVADRSAITNANQHQARPFLLNLDLENYFGSITTNRVRGLLTAISLPQLNADLIATLCTTANQLPQGAPTSPILANMVTHRLDKELMAFAARHRLRYTRYADDLSFSSYVQPTALFADAIPLPGRIAVSELSVELQSLILGNGFRINPGKVWFADKRTRKEVTGLIVNEFTNIRRTHVRSIRAGLHRLDTLGVSAALSAYEPRPGNKGTFDQVLRGQLEWLAQVRGRSFSAYRTLAKRYNTHFPGTPLPIDPTHEEIARDAVFVVDWESPDGSDCGQGTAFFLAGSGLVTAEHVVSGLAGGKAEIYRPHKPTLKYSATLSPVYSAHADLALLDHDVPVSEQAWLEASLGGERAGEPIKALGFPDYAPGDELSVREGKIVGRSTKSAVRMVEVDAILPDGMSGGPIVNSRYQVLAVIKKGGPLEHRQLGVDLTELAKLIDASKTASAVAPPPSSSP
ncbi:reverse transcriptase domain-containing protein [Phenylobacterium sp.]|uniref:reverse transcriptase domain-containing protein n=1 Tax=Phenylobacterium sp. TaxID=1871053 RepID=UPI00289C5E93|nr:reverse transcriptase domain-containing protein [Phenylobacterium sp.]